ncbi:MAG: hypothetical protein HRU15_17665 [Planctomycetes bacterium]|nr:hypothetical protein [Planctomycetota bacterium]
MITYDWVRMKSGEWLKGELKSFRDDVIEFESDEFGDQVLDLADGCS